MIIIMPNKPIAIAVILLFPIVSFRSMLESTEINIGATKNKAVASAKGKITKAVK